MKHVLLLSLIISISACTSPQVQPPSNQIVPPELQENVAIMDDGYASPFISNVAESPDAVFVALHGFNDYSNAFKGFCEYMAAQGKHCYAYDQRGFGRSEYTGIWPAANRLQQDLRIWVNLLKAKYPELPLYVAGESMGGAVVMTAMQQYAFDNVDGFILFAPAVWARTTQPWYQRLGLWVALRTVPGWKPTGKGIKRIASNNREALIANGRDPLFIKGTRIDAIYGLTNLMDQALAVSQDETVAQKNTLMLYGANDQIIPKKPTCMAVDNIATQANAWQLQHYPEGYHMLTRDLEAEDTFANVVQWLNNGLPEDSLMQRYCTND